MKTGKKQSHVKQTFIFSIAIYKCFVILQKKIKIIQNIYSIPRIFYYISQWHIFQMFKKADN